MKKLSQKEYDGIISAVTENRVRFAYALKKLMPNSSADDTEECISRLYLTVFENYNNYKASPNRTGWLMLTFKNIVFDYRREKYQFNVDPEDISEREASLSCGYDENDVIFGILTNHAPQDVLICKVLSALTEKERELYDMRFVRKMKHEEIAAAVGVSASGVRRRVSELKAKIRDTVYSGKLFEYVNKNK
jgi:RNA polymerase sigma factor (sigma-70 family)